MQGSLWIPFSGVGDFLQAMTLPLHKLKQELWQTAPPQTLRLSF